MRHSPWSHSQAGAEPGPARQSGCAASGISYRRSLARVPSDGTSDVSVAVSDGRAPWLTVTAGPAARGVWRVGTGLLRQMHGPESARPRPASGLLPSPCPCRGDAVRLHLPVMTSACGRPCPGPVPAFGPPEPTSLRLDKWPVRPLFPLKVTFEVLGARTPACQRGGRVGPRQCLTRKPCS